jgi:hypothetical protein
MAGSDVSFGPWWHLLVGHGSGLKRLAVNWRSRRSQRSDIALRMNFCCWPMPGVGQGPGDRVDHALFEVFAKRQQDVLGADEALAGASATGMDVRATPPPRELPVRVRAGRATGVTLRRVRLGPRSSPARAGAVSGVVAAASETGCGMARSSTLTQGGPVRPAYNPTLTVGHIHRSQLWQFSKPKSVVLHHF